tara:strand:+ start:756 stop:1058 length:303 start_codon:yes stop_codon:yes gene_type:complete
MATNEKYLDKGTLWINKDKTDKAPIAKGDLKLSPLTVKGLLAKITAGEDAVIKLSSWKKTVTTKMGEKDILTLAVDDESWKQNGSYNNNKSDMRDDPLDF